MTREDDRILKHLAEEPWSNPRIISTEVFRKVSEGHVNDRLLYLEFAGLVARVHSDMWEITTRGLQYLDGEIDAEYLPRPNRGYVFDQFTESVRLGI